MDTNTDPHKHMLRSLNNLFSILKQVCPLQGTKAEIIVIVVTSVDQARLNLLDVLLNDLVNIISEHGGRSANLVGEVFEALRDFEEVGCGLLVEVRD